MAELGIVEGYFGPRWSWKDRAFVMRYLAKYGYKTYLYAPKADQYLRKRWQNTHPAGEQRKIAQFAALCSKAGVRFGIGVSPFELYKNFDRPARSSLAFKIAALEDIGINELSIFFDDMQGSLPDLAERQIEIMNFVNDQSSLERISFCPTYYSDDVVLDRAFGQRPDNYLETLGCGLPDRMDIMWTGEEVCARAMSIQHLKNVAHQLKRKPVIWDNYPVNDGPCKSQFLHIRGFTGRHAENGKYIARHLINPALQSHLSIIPAITLADVYSLGSQYNYAESTHKAAVHLLGRALADQVRMDLIALNDTGLDRLGEKWLELRTTYLRFKHPVADEILSWLDGKWRGSGVEMEIS